MRIKAERIAAGSGVYVALCLLIGKGIGAAYKIPLVNVLGAEGIGAYQLVFPVYAAALALTSGSCGVIISRNVAARRANGEIKDMCGSCFLYTFIFSLSAAVLLCALSGVIAEVQGNEDIKNCYLIIAPAVVFVGMSACFKGIFTGEGKVYFSAVCQLLEQLIKAAFGIVLSLYLSSFSLIGGVMGAVAGVTVSELFSLIICLFYYAFSKQKYRIKPSFSREFFRENKFITAHGLILPLSALADGILIVKLMTVFGYKDAAAKYGIMSGSVNTVINMPIVIALSAAVTLIPAVSYFYALNSASSIKEKSSKCIKYVLFITCACFFGVFLLAEEIVEILFSSFSEENMKTAAFLMKISSVNIITASLSGVYNSVLQAVDGGGYCLKVSGILSILRVAAEIGLIYKAGIVGAAVSWVAYYMLNMLFGAVFYRRLLGEDKNLLKNTVKILLSGVIMSLTLYLIRPLLTGLLLRAAVCTAAGAAVYILSCIIMRVFKYEEIKNASALRSRRREKWHSSR